jgi:formylglycine-generating enzyme required for sulfatase activity
VRLAKVVVIQHSHPDLYELLKLTPRYLRDLEIHYVDQRDERDSEQATEDTIEGTAEAETPRKASLPGPLQPFGERASLRRLFRLFPDDGNACFRFLTPTDLRLYLTLAGRAETERRHETAAKKPRLDFEPEMTQIPAGQFIMGTPPEEAKQFGEEAQRETPQHTVELPAYEIGRYPVTNLEYKAFVEATNHEPPGHWQGGELPVELADHPVTRVSWEDAIAYCQWLVETTQKSYRLPTEQEWERAARGAAGLRYPWGNEWQEKRANTKEAGIGTTTPVGQYSPDGDSLDGCADMAGNVWEWTDNLFAPYSGSNYHDELYGRGLKVLRGGSYDSDKNTARAVFRYRINTPSRYWGVGFRVVVGAASSPLSSESSAL